MYAVGTIVNTSAVIAGSVIGLVFRRHFPVRYQDVYFQAVGLFTMLLGLKMSLQMTFPLLVILSLVLGGFIGVRYRLTDRADRLGDYIKRWSHLGDDRFSEGLTTGFLLFCTGSMTILGAIEEGYGKTSELLLTKSIMDFFSSVMLASALGVGVLCSAFLLLLFQGGITVLVTLLGSGIPAEMINEITVVGGIILIGLSLTLLKLKQIKVLDFLPSLLMIGIFVYLRSIIME